MKNTDNKLRRDLALRKAAREAGKPFDLSLVEAPRPKIGQDLTLYGKRCTIINVFSFGTVDVVAHGENKAWRVTGLSFI